MKDSKPVLEYGTGTPYLAIFDGAGNPIYDTKNNLPIGMLVSDFNYVYNEDDIDEGYFVIETDNSDLPSLGTLGYHMSIKLQWGWIYPKGPAYCGPVRTVMIIGHDITFGQQGVKIKIEFADSTILLKELQSTYPDDESSLNDIVKWVEALAKGSVVNIKFIDRSLDPDSQYKYDTKESQNTETVKGVAYSEDGKFGIVTDTQGYDHQGTRGHELNTDFKYNQNVYINPQDYIFGKRDGAPDLENLDKVLFAEYNSETASLVEKDPAKFKEVNIINPKSNVAVLVGNAKNRFGQFKNLVRNLTGGPYHVGGRDGQCVISNENFDGPIIKCYTYNGGNGELLIFNVSSNIVDDTVEVEQNTWLNPDNKEVVQQTVQWLMGFTPDATQIFDQTTAIDNTSHKGAESPVEPLMKTAEDMGEPLLIADPLAVNGRLFINPEVAKEYYRRMSQGDNKPRSGKDKSFYRDLEIDGPIKHEIFDSEQAAINHYTQNPGISQEEYQEFINQVKSKVSSWNNLSDPKNFTEAIRSSNDLGFLTIKRTVWIYREELNLNPTSRRYGKSGDTSEVPIKHEENIDPYRDGMQPYSYLKEKGKIISTTRVDKAPDTYIAAGPDMGRSTTIYNEGMRSRQYIEEKEVEIPIAGARVLTLGWNETTQNQMANDVASNMGRQTSAKATVVGDPKVQSSQNIMIQNVSKRYSGVWYTKTVTHKMNSSTGYLCEIEFVERKTAINHSVLKNTLKTRSVYKDLNDAAKKIVEMYGGSGDGMVNDQHLEDVMIQKQFKMPTDLFYIEGKNTYGIDTNKGMRTYTSEEPISRGLYKTKDSYSVDSNK